ncbi:MAG: restriction endonuclease subunit S [Lactobacillus sp.]|nr:restriction endonuclease subunit S [Lactobacillus sp.]
MGETLTGFEYGLNTPATDYDGINKYLRITDIDDVSHKFDISHLTSPKLKDDNYLLANGDILFARTGASVGKSYRYSNIDGKVYYAGFLIKAHIKDYFSTNFIFDTTLLPRYHYFVQVTSMRSGQPGINAKEYQKYIIYTPSENEQNKISDLILTIQKLIDLQQRKLEQLKQLKKAMLQQIFVSKNSKQPVLRFENFDSDWRQHSLEDISAKTYSGLTGKSKDDFGHGKARYITYLNVHNNEVAVSDGVEQIEVDSKQNKVLKGDLLFTISSEVPSEVALNSVWSSEAGTDTYLNSFCFGIRPKSNYVNSFFLTYYLRSPQMRKLIYPLAQGISRFNISKRSILALKINTPVLPEQISIYKVLMHIDNLITHQQNKLTQLTTLKKYLLQKLFI